MDRGSKSLAKLKRSNSQTKTQAQHVTTEVSGNSLEQICDLLGEISVQYIAKNGLCFTQAHPCVMRKICEKDSGHICSQISTLEKTKKQRTSNRSLSRG